MSAPRQFPGSPATPTLSVRTEDGHILRFSRPFQVGRERDCDVRLDNALVSRKHLMVSFEEGHWQIRDQQSGNGVFIDGRRIETAAIDKSLTVRLGANGPVVVMEVEAAGLPTKHAPVTERSAGETVMLASYAERYFGAATDEEAVGGRTMMIRKAFHSVQKKQKRMYRSVVAVAVLIALAAGGYAYYGHRQMMAQRAVALELFYAMKSLDLSIAKVEQRVAPSGNANSQEVRAYMERRRQMEGNYDRFLAGLKLYDRPLTEQEHLILRVTRLFGECEMAAPPEYLAEVGNYIRSWQSSGRYARAVNLARQMGYAKKIAEEFQKQNLPPQFFYLAMQESDFNEVASGPPTRMGIAKGMWQFIPDTATRYGLKVGPLAAVPQPDPVDDRHNWQKATAAAARYIKEIYATDAQASGLLVMASYNWGEHRIINMLKKMPENPSERNFWKVLEQHRNQVPKETYDYVLSIVSAAVIGENPRLFGFTFDSPLAFMDQP